MDQNTRAISLIHTNSQLLAKETYFLNASRTLTIGVVATHHYNICNTGRSAFIFLSEETRVLEYSTTDEFHRPCLVSMSATLDIGSDTIPLRSAAPGLLTDQWRDIFETVSIL